MSDSVEHGTWRVKVTNQLLINVLDELEPIQKLLNQKDAEIYELKEKLEAAQQEITDLEVIIAAKDDTIDELPRVIRDNTLDKEVSYGVG